MGFTGAARAAAAVRRVSRRSQHGQIARADPWPPRPRHCRAGPLLTAPQPRTALPLRSPIPVGLSGSAARHAGELTWDVGSGSLAATSAGRRSPARVQTGKGSILLGWRHSSFFVSVFPSSYPRAHWGV